MKITPKTAEAYQLFHDGILALARAEMQGMRVDLNYIEETGCKLQEQLNEVECKLKETKFYRRWEHMYGRKVNYNSDRQLSHFLYSVLKLEPVKVTGSGMGSVDDESLKQLGIPELDYILEIRRLSKAKDTYLEAFTREQIDGYIHPHFNLHNVISYRSSSDSPNFQNLPKRNKEIMAYVRNAIYPRPGHLLMEVDFSGLEVSIAACYHKDPTMIKYLTTNGDMHGDMASQIFCIEDFDKEKPGYKVLRSAAKNAFVFPQFYGDYYKNNAIGLCQWVQLPRTSWERGMGIFVDDRHISDILMESGINSFDAFVTHIQRIEKHFWQKRFKVYAQWKEKWYSDYLKNGYVDSFTGFRFRGEMRRNEVINYPIQGAAFHCLLWSFIQLDKWLIEKNYDSRLIGQIHDAMVLDVSPNELYKVARMIKRITTIELSRNWNWIIVPLSVEVEIGDIDGSWATLKHFEL